MPSGKTAVHALVFTACNEKSLFLLVSIVADFSAADQVPTKSKVTMRPAIVDVVVVGGTVVVAAIVVTGAVVGGVVVVFARRAMVVSTTVFTVVCGDGEAAIETATVLEATAGLVVVDCTATVVEVVDGSVVVIEIDVSDASDDTGSSPPQDLRRDVVTAIKTRIARRETKTFQTPHPFFSNSHPLSAADCNIARSFVRIDRPRSLREFSAMTGAAPLARRTSRLKEV